LPSIKNTDGYLLQSRLDQTITNGTDLAKEITVVSSQGKRMILCTLLKIVMLTCWNSS
jgi:hypothetical protein